MSTNILSEKTARALDQVKSGLSMLYMVDYFTEDEWMKIDFCIHKGKYVFTKGPPRHILDLDLDLGDEGQSSEAATSLLLDHVDHPQSAERQEKESENAPVESAGETIDAVGSGTGSTLDLSSPPSSIEEPAEVPAGDGITSWVAKVEKEEEAPFDLLLEMSQPPQPPKPAEAPPTNRGPIYTQEQLEAAKAMNKAFTKAPEPGSGRSRKVVSNHKDNYRENEEPVQGTEEYLSSNTTEDNRRINQWATEAESASQNIYPTDPQERLVTEYIQKHGKIPSVNDIYQPNNRGFVPLTARTTSTKSSERREFAKSLAAVVGRLQPKRGTSMTNFKPGVVFIAQVDVPTPSKVCMAVKAGDSIKVLKHVSGIRHLGENLTSGTIGQFSEEIFSRPTAPQRRVAPSEPETASVVDLDHFERDNAAQWDEVPASKRARAPAPAVSSNFGGLARSRYAILEDEKDGGSEDVKIHSQQGQMQYPTRRPHEPKTSWKEPLKPVEPRRETCTMWAIATCRFKAEECRDLHAIVDLLPGEEPRNIRDGKPTWGALADYLPPPSESTSHFMTAAPTSVTEYSSQVSEHEDRRLHSPPMSPATMRSSLSGPGVSKFDVTCPYWAERGKCFKSAEQCQFLHAWSEAGVAPKPGSRGHKARINIRTPDWNRWDNPLHPARDPENQTFRPAPGGQEWRMEEEQRERERENSLRGENASELGYQTEEQGQQASWNRSGPVESQPAQSEKPAWDRASGEYVETPPAEKVSDADGWIVATQQDLKQEIGW